MARAHRHVPKADGTCRGCGVEVAVVTLEDLILSWMDPAHRLTCPNCSERAGAAFARARRGQHRA